MKKTTRTLATLAVGALATGGLVFGTAGAAFAAPECVSGGISRTVGADGVPVYQNDANCGPAYQYEQQYEVTVPEPQPQVGLPSFPWGCEGVVASVACRHAGTQEYIEIDGNYYFNHDYVPPAPIEEDTPEGNVEVGELEVIHVTPENSGGGGGGGFGYGGGYSGGFGGGFGGSSGGSGGKPTVTVGDVETVQQ